MSGLTLDKLARALKGMPREARILIRLPGGELVDVDHVTAAHVRADNTALASGASTTQSGKYGIILVTKNNVFGTL